MLKVGDEHEKLVSIVVEMNVVDRLAVVGIAVADIAVADIDDAAAAAAAAEDRCHLYLGGTSRGNYWFALSDDVFPLVPRMGLGSCYK